jgi:hypothetical protein
MTPSSRKTDMPENMNNIMFISSSTKALPQDSMSEQSTTKRGPGRPRKNPLTVGVVVKNDSQSSEPKRGRGRPRKNPLSVGVVVKNDSQSSEPKRGRGRPRKNPMSVDVLVNSVHQSSEPKRGRGRPRKNPETVSNVSQTSELNEDFSSTAKRGRGRPKKNVAQEQKNVDLVLISSNINLQEDKKQTDFVLDKSIVNKTEHENLIEQEKKRQKIINFKVGSNADNVSKPSINHLPNAYSIDYTDSGRVFTFLCNIGDKIVIEYPQNWRRTEEWIIDRIDYENGDLLLKHSIDGFYASCNFIVGPIIYGVKIKKVNV